jgi:protein-tyrosine phosphatase
MIDFHSHLVPGVDDGASSLDEALAGLGEMRAQGVHTVVTTPHLGASLAATDPEAHASYLAAVDAAFDALAEAAARAYPDVHLERGFEVMLDTPRPDFADPRVRLAGTRAVLVEFPFMNVPPNVSGVLFEVGMGGWAAVVAHPERYGNLQDPSEAEGWRRAGARLQVNHGSLLGKYGPQARDRAVALLRRGLVDYLSSDYHARGSCHVAAGRAEAARLVGEERAALLTETNPARLLEGRPPLPVPPCADERRPFWSRLLGR